MDVVSLVMGKAMNAMSHNSAPECVFAKQKINMSAAYGMIYYSFSATCEKADMMTVIYNDVPYTLTVNHYGSDGISIFEDYVGNAHIYNAACEDTGEPFVLFFSFGSNKPYNFIINESLSECTLAIYSQNKVYKTFDVNNMPEGYPAIIKGNRCVAFDTADYCHLDEAYLNVLWNKNLKYEVLFDGESHKYDSMTSFVDSDDLPGAFIGNGRLFSWATDPSAFPDTGEDFCLVFYDGEDVCYIFLSEEDRGHEISCFCTAPNEYKGIDINLLPTVTTADNGKILKVVNGKWALVNA